MSVDAYIKECFQHRHHKDVERYVKEFRSQPQTMMLDRLDRQILNKTYPETCRKKPGSCYWARWLPTTKPLPKSACDLRKFRLRNAGTRVRYRLAASTACLLFVSTLSVCVRQFKLEDRAAQVKALGLSFLEEKQS